MPSHTIADLGKRWGWVGNLNDLAASQPIRIKEGMRGQKEEYPRSCTC